jgi:hypothetical protein
MPNKDEPPKTLVQYQAQYNGLVKTLIDIGFIWPGTLQSRMLTCGRSWCACHEDPKKRHGPYWYWTSKKEGKTISRKLTPEEAEIIKPWIENRRRIEVTLREMSRVSEQALTLMLRQPDGN